MTALSSAVEARMPGPPQTERPLEQSRFGILAESTCTIEPQVSISMMEERAKAEGAMSTLVRKHCLFCAEPLSKAMSTNDHPVPQWLLRHFHAGGKMIEPAGWQEGVKLRRPPHRWLNLVISDVCVTCNSGWFSDLENAIKPLLPGLATQDRALSALSEQEQLVLARWAAKTTFLVQRTAGVPLPIAPEAYRALREAPGHLPQGTFVFAFQDNGEHPVAINGLQTQDWTVHVPYGNALEIRALLRKTGKMSLRIKRLHLLVAYVGETDLEPVGWWRVHHPVFPTRCRHWIDAGFKIDQVTPRQESSMVLFHVALGLALHCSQEQLARKPPPNLEELHEQFFARHKQRGL